MAKRYRRERYLEKIRPFVDDTGLIKVVTGIRRCGKSCLMETVAEELRERGVDVSGPRKPRLAATWPLGPIDSGQKPA